MRFFLSPCVVGTLPCGVLLNGSVNAFGLDPAVVIGAFSTLLKASLEECKLGSDQIL